MADVVADVEAVSVSVVRLTKEQRAKRLRIIFICMAVLSIVINLDGGR